FIQKSFEMNSFPVLHKFKETDPSIICAFKECKLSGANIFYEISHSDTESLKRLCTNALNTFNLRKKYLEQKKKDEEKAAKKAGKKAAKKNKEEDPIPLATVFLFRNMHVTKEHIDIICSYVYNHEDIFNALQLYIYSCTCYTDFDEIKDYAKSLRDHPPNICDYGTNIKVFDEFDSHIKSTVSQGDSLFQLTSTTDDESLIDLIKRSINLPRHKFLIDIIDPCLGSRYTFRHHDFTFSNMVIEPRHIHIMQHYNCKNEELSARIIVYKSRFHEDCIRVDKDGKRFLFMNYRYNTRIFLNECKINFHAIETTGPEYSVIFTKCTKPNGKHLKRITDWRLQGNNTEMVVRGVLNVIKFPCSQKSNDEEFVDISNETTTHSI
ncbi:MAG: hypothetical protein KDH96_07305, partial [Candidatus Riesia sp.]|nr:hypothetical protein [Candidatus Riesia sp.]